MYNLRGFKRHENAILELILLQSDLLVGPSFSFARIYWWLLWHWAVQTGTFAGSWRCILERLIILENDFIQELNFPMFFHELRDSFFLGRLDAAKNFTGTRESVMNRSRNVLVVSSCQSVRASMSFSLYDAHTSRVRIDGYQILFAQLTATRFFCWRTFILVK